jgi:hypothetical protein
MAFKADSMKDGKVGKGKKTGKAGRPAGRVRTRHVAVEFHPAHDEKHYVRAWELLRTGLPVAFQAITGLPRALLHERYRDMLNRARKDYPHLRKSALRLFMEGALTDGQPVLRTIPTGAARRLEAALEFLDVLETLVYLEGAKRLDQLDLMAAPKNPYKYRPAALRAKKPVEPEPELPPLNPSVEEVREAVADMMGGGLEVLLGEGVDTEYEEEDEEGDTDGDGNETGENENGESMADDLEHENA